MLPSEVASALRSKLTTDWAALHAAVPLVWPNEDNQMPLDSEGAPTAFIAAFVRFGAAPRLAAYGGIAQNRWRQGGEVVARIFVPRGGGEATINGYADDLSGILIGYRDGDLFVRGAGPVSEGFLSDENGPLYEKDVLADFLFDRIA